MVPSVREKLSGARVGSWYFPFVPLVSDGSEKVRGFVEPFLAAMMNRRRFDIGRSRLGQTERRTRELGCRQASVLLVLCQ
jgi:hypothetical protein